MEIRVNNLILELTRRCNMKCEHCMRGNPQRVDMLPGTINRLMNQISCVDSVTFTGGEPSLKVDLIEHFTDYCWVNKDRRPNSFYVVSNGKRNSIKLSQALLRLYNHLGCDYSDEMTGLAMSQDQFHEGLPIPRAFRALSFFREDSHNKLEYRSILDEGRAHENGLGRNGQRSNEFEIQYDGETDDMWVDTLNVSANGNLNACCDMSYKRADAEAIGNVTGNTPLDVLLMAEYRKQHPEELKEAA